MTMRKLRGLVHAMVLSVSLSACAASAHFYSKNGQVYPEVTAQAVRCDEDEVGAVMGAGGFPIGVIDAKGLTLNATDNDLAAKAAKIAAKNGGTHVILTERGVDTFTTTTAGQYERDCTRDHHTTDCHTVYTPPTTSTFEKPTAQFVVFMVPPGRWAQLPPALQPRAER